MHKSRIELLISPKVNLVLEGMSQRWGVFDVEEEKADLGIMQLTGSEVPEATVIPGNEITTNTPQRVALHAIDGAVNEADTLDAARQSARQEVAASFSEIEAAQLRKAA